MGRIVTGQHLPPCISCITFCGEGGLVKISNVFRAFLLSQKPGGAPLAIDPATAKIIAQAAIKVATDEDASLYDLTKAGQELLLAKKRGHALFMVGAKRLHINFEMPDYKMAYMGKAGGR